MKCGRILTILLFLVGGRWVVPVQAEWAVSVNSTYLGNGQFQYHVDMQHGVILPYFESVMCAFSFTSNHQVAVPPVDGWIISNTFDSVSWESALPVPEPMVGDFTIQGGTSGCTTGSMYIMFICPMLVMDRCTASDPFYVLSRNMAGYSRHPCLIPSPAVVGEDSPTNQLSSYIIIPDPDCTVAEQGLTFFWTNSMSTVLIEASSNLSSWMPIGCTFGQPVPQGTLWTSSVPLFSLGQYFRVQLMAGTNCQNILDDFYSNHTAYAVQDRATLGIIAPDAPVRIVELNDRHMVIEADTHPGVSYHAWQETLAGTRVGDAQSFVAENEISRLLFPAPATVSSARFRVRADNQE